MSLIIRVTSADNKKVFTRQLAEGETRVKLPKDATIAVIDEATGEVVPVIPKIEVNAVGEEILTFTAEADGEEFAVVVEEAALWPADTDVNLAEGLDGAVTVADGRPAEAGAAEREGSGFEIGEALEGMPVLGWILAGAIVVGTAVIIADDSDDDDDGEDPQIPDDGGPDTTAPNPPVNLRLDDSTDTGVSMDDNITNLTEVLITGNAEEFSDLELFVNGESAATGAAVAGGRFEIMVTLPEGTNEITITSTDAAGNTSDPSDPLTVVVDVTPPAVPTIDLDAASDGGEDDEDDFTPDADVTFTGTADAGTTVELFADGVSLGTTTATDEGDYSIDVTLPEGTSAVTAVSSDVAGNTATSEELDVTVDSTGPALVNSSVDGSGSVVTFYFDEALDEDAVPTAEDITITQGDETAEISSIDVNGNRVSVVLAEPLAMDGDVSFTFAGDAIADLIGNPAATVTDQVISNFLSTEASGALQFGQVANIALAGAEIVAFDPETDRFFVTSGDGLQVIGVDENLELTVLGTVELGTNEITSVAVSNGNVAVAVAADPATDPGSVFLLDASADVGPDMIVNEVTVGALPDMVTFTPDGNTVLVANEGESTTLEDVEEGADFVNPEGSVALIDISGGLDAATVQIADFTAFNDQLEQLRAEGVRLFAGLGGFEDITVAQDLEPEYIAVSPDGTTALITLQEANAVAVLDIASATITDIRPLGLKPYDGLPFDLTDEDEVYAPRTDNENVFGQFMPDAIASFTGGDGETYYVIANEGDDREDFVDPEPNGRVDDLVLDPEVFPNAAELQDDFQLGRLGVTVFPGLDGDTDGDGDSDQILAYGGRSFSILNAEGVIVFDSGSQIEEFVGAGGLFDEDTNEGLFDDGRSDNKGPEPEGITTGVFGDSVLAFVALERGGGGVMVYDVTDPTSVEFVTYIRDMRDVSPEGLIYIPAEDSPTGQPLLTVASEESSTLTVFEVAPEGTYTLQLLHFADGEAKNLAIDTAPNLAALVDAFEDDYANSITLSGGDNYIPGLFFTAQSDSSVADALGFSGGPKVDIAIHNAIGVQASTVGNHEFDRGTGNFASAIAASGEYEGALFPYLSANLDFSGDSSLAPLFQETIGDGDLEFASDLSNTIVPSAVIEEGGELIGVVGATTQVLSMLTSVGGVDVKGTNEDNMELLALQLQPYIDDLIAQGVNKIILMSHLQELELEEELAPLLEGVDIILAAGSNTRLSDADDELVALPGHPAESEGDYPIVTQGADGGTTLIVNTDNEFTYLGRLVVDFDADGNIILDSLDETINGAYASTDEQVAEAWNVEVDDFDETAFAEGTRGGEVRDLIAPVAEVLETQGSNVFGFSDVFLEGARAVVRAEETNLGNLTADANADAAREALGLGLDDVVVSYKNGGGIRDSIGSISGTGSNVVQVPNDGGVVTELDVGSALAFNNGLIVFDTTPEGLLAILNSPNSFEDGNGGFAQLSGLQVSYDPDAPQGDRVVDVALVDGNGNKTALVDDGEVVAGAPASITMVTLDFIAGNDGDGVEIAENGTNFRYIVDNGDGTYSLSNPIGTLADDDFAGDIVIDIESFTGNALGEQQALADYLGEFFGTPDMAFDMPDTPQSEDERIQNINERADTVLDDAMGLAPVAFTGEAGMEAMLASDVFA